MLETRFRSMSACFCCWNKWIMLNLGCQFCHGELGLKKELWGGQASVFVVTSASDNVAVCCCGSEAKCLPHARTHVKFPKPFPALRGCKECLCALGCFVSSEPGIRHHRGEQFCHRATCRPKGSSLASYLCSMRCRVSCRICQPYGTCVGTLLLPLI